MYRYAEVVKTTRAQVPIELVLRTGKFDLADASNAAGWLQRLQGRNKDVTETKAYGIASFVYQQRTPFHPLRLYKFIEDNFMVDLNADDVEEEEEEEEADETMDAAEKERAPLEVRQAACDAKIEAQRARFGRILRSKGFVWIAGRDNMSGEWGQAGAVLELGCAGPWMGLMPKHMWPEEGSEERDMMERDMSGPVLLDRRQELVFIWQNLNECVIVAALNDCLVTRAEASALRARQHSEAGGGGGGGGERREEWKLRWGCTS